MIMIIVIMNTTEWYKGRRADYESIWYSKVFMYVEDTWSGSARFMKSSFSQVLLFSVPTIWTKLCSPQGWIHSPPLFWQSNDFSTRNFKYPSREKVRWEESPRKQNRSNRKFRNLHTDLSLKEMAHILELQTRSVEIWCSHSSTFP